MLSTLSWMKLQRQPPTICHISRKPRTAQPTVKHLELRCIHVSRKSLPLLNMITLRATPLVRRGRCTHSTLHVLLPLEQKGVCNMYVYTPIHIPTSDYSQNEQRIVDAAANIFLNDPCRTSIPGLTIEDDSLRLWYFCRSHVAVSETILFHKVCLYYETCIY